MNESTGWKCWTTLMLASLLLTSGCATKASRPAAKPIVEVVTVEQQDVPIYHEWIGTLDGIINASIKAQVTGYLAEQVYSAGSYVKKGQLLFEIDPRPFRAALDRAHGQLSQANGQLAQSKAQLSQDEAQLAVAEANQGRTQLDVDRYYPLAMQQAITQQDLDNAKQNNQAAKAQVKSAEAAVEVARAQIEAANAAVEAAAAAVETAKLNLEFTRLVSPIDGIAGMAQQQVGDLASPGGPPVTVVSTVNPIKVYFTIGEQEYLEYEQTLLRESGRNSGDKEAPLELILADGSVYPRKGNLYYTDRAVDQTTGSMRIAGLFPNPGNVLRPGQFARVRMKTRTRRSALLVPQRAVTELQGSYQVAVVGGKDTIDIRTVKVGDRVGSMWIINEGLSPGERVVAEGVQKVRSGIQVQPEQFKSAAKMKER
jgi:membrane fusion protein (multidrug efflux system)